MFRLSEPPLGSPGTALAGGANFSANFLVPHRGDLWRFLTISVPDRHTGLEADNRENPTKKALFRAEKGLESWHARQDSNLRPSA